MRNVPKERRLFLPSVRRYFSFGSDYLPSSAYTSEFPGPPTSTIPGGFNDPSTADLILRLYEENCPYGYDSRPLFEVEYDSDSDPDAEHRICTDSELLLYVHSAVLRRAKYFSDLFSDRSIGDVLEVSSNPKYHWLHLGVAKETTIHSHVVVIRLLYTNDFESTLLTVSSALDIFPVALKLFFEDCIKQCVQCLDNRGWREEDEERIADMFSVLSDDDSEARVFRPKPAPSEELIQSLIIMALKNDSGVYLVKGFVWSLLRVFPMRHTAGRVLAIIFSRSLKAARDSLVNYSSERPSISHFTALNNCKHLTWTVEKMFELGEPEFAVIKEWSEQASFSANLRRIFGEDAWRYFVPDISNLVLNCCNKLLGSYQIASIEVKKQLVENWVPFLVVCKQNANAIPLSSYRKRKLYRSEDLQQELEEAFLKIISTITMSDGQELLQKCLTLFPCDVDFVADPVKAFETWFSSFSCASTRPWKKRYHPYF